MGGKTSGPRYGMVKWWSKHERVNGLITQTVSPYQSDVAGSFFNNFGKKVMSRLKVWSGTMPYVAALCAVYTWANYEHDRLIRAERD